MSRSCALHRPSWVTMLLCLTSILTVSLAVTSSRTACAAPQQATPANKNPNVAKAKSMITFLDIVGEAVGNADTVNSAAEQARKTSEKLSRFQIAAWTNDAAKKSFESLSQRGKTYKTLVKRIQDPNAFGKTLEYTGYIIDGSKIALKVYSAKQEKGNIEAVNVAIREMLIYGAKKGVEAVEKYGGEKIGAAIGSLFGPAGTVIGGVAGGLIVPVVMKHFITEEGIEKTVGDFYDNTLANPVRNSTKYLSDQATQLYDKYFGDTAQKYTGLAPGQQQTAGNHSPPGAKPGNVLPAAGGTGNHSPGATATGGTGQPGSTSPTTQKPGASATKPVSGKPAPAGDKKPAGPHRPVTEGDDWYSNYLKDVTKGK